MIPNRPEFARVQLLDETGRKAFEFQLSEALRVSARDTRRHTLNEIETMRRGGESVQTSHQDSKTADRSGVLAQMRHEHANSSGVPYAGLEAAEAGIWQDTGDLPVMPSRQKPHRLEPRKRVDIGDRDAKDPISQADFRPDDFEKAAHNAMAAGDADLAEQAELELELRREMELELDLMRELELERLARLGLLAREVSSDSQKSAMQAARRAPRTSADTVTLSGTVVLPGGDPPNEGFWAQLLDDDGTFDWAWVGADGVFEFALPPNRPFDLELLPPAPYLRAVFPVNIDRDAATTYRLERGALLIGDIETSDGNALPDDEFWVFLYRDREFISSHLVQEGGFDVALEPGVEHRLSFSSPVPYAKAEKFVTLDGDQTMTFEIQRGAVLDGRVVTSDGGEFPEPFWVWFWRSDDGSFFGGVRIESDGLFQIVLEPDADYDMRLDAPAPYLVNRTTLTLSQDMAQSFEIQRGALLDGRAAASDGGEFSEQFWVRFRRSEDGSWFGSVEAETDGRFLIALEPDVTYDIEIDVPAPYLEGNFTLTLSQDSAQSFEIQRGAMLDGRAVTSDGEDFHERFWVRFRRSDDGSWFGSVKAETDGRFSIALEPDVTYDMEIDVPVPYLEGNFTLTLTLSQDAVQSFEIQRGVLAALGVFGADGQLLRAERVVVSQQGTSRWLTPNSAERLNLVLVPEQPASVSVEPPQDEGLLVKNIAIEPRTTDFDLDVTLEPGGTLSGIVEDRDGEPVALAELRFFQGSRLVKSVETLGDGSYELLLPQGRYRAEVLVAPGRPLARDHSATFFQADPRAVDVNAVEQTLNVRLARPMHTLTTPHFIPGANFQRARLTFHPQTGREGHVYTWASGEGIKVMQGVYDIEIDYPGFAPAKSDRGRYFTSDLDAGSWPVFIGESSSLDAVSCYLTPKASRWPMSNTLFTTERTSVQRYWARTGAAGEFEVPLGRRFVSLNSAGSAADRFSRSTADWSRN